MTFPQNALLDNFNRANENPLSNGGKWTMWSVVGSGITNAPQLVSNVIRALSAGTDVGGYWNPVTFGPDCEAYATINAFDTTQASSIYNVGVCIASGVSYRHHLEIQTTGGFFRSQIIRDGANSWTVNYSAPATAVAIGDKFGIRVVGRIIEAWYWTTVLGWRRVGAVNDATQTGGAAALASGFAGVSVGNVVSGLAGLAQVDDFGAGTVVGSPSAITDMGSTVKSDTPLLAKFADKLITTPGGGSPRPTVGQLWPWGGND